MERRVYSARGWRVNRAKRSLEPPIIFLYAESAMIKELKLKERNWKKGIERKKMKERNKKVKIELNWIELNYYQQNKEANNYMNNTLNKNKTLYNAEQV